MSLIWTRLDSNPMARTPSKCIVTSLEMLHLVSDPRPSLEQPYTSP
jgi:hypothetical protein